MTIAGSTNGHANGTGSAAKFAFPAGIAIDKQGNLYVADSENHCIRKVTQNGEVTTFAGTKMQVTNDGTAVTTTCSIPRFTRHHVCYGCGWSQGADVGSIQLLEILKEKPRLIGRLHQHDASRC